MRCRHCASAVQLTFLDLGFAPPSNAYISTDDLSKPETYYPLRVKVCDQCWLVQTEDFADAGDLFGADYAYFSSTSAGWVAHAERFVGRISRELGLGEASMVIEVASNDGYLLRYFISLGIPCLGIEPTASTAAVAEALGVPVLREFFGRDLGRRLSNDGLQADLIIGNNVFAHVPDINDFSRGLASALKPGGTITLEFPHLMRLLENGQFDTIYHEHFSYLSLGSATRILAAAGLRVWRVEELPTHGGSLRLYCCLEGDSRGEDPSVSELLRAEAEGGLGEAGTYTSFQTRVDRIKDDLLSYLIDRKHSGVTVGAYGAAAKGSTLLNYAGVKQDLLPYVCDLAPAKQGMYLPGSHIPICSPDVLRQAPPDELLILPWNIAEEVMEQNADLSQRGMRFVTAIPELTVR